MFSALFAPCASIIRGFRCAKNVQKCAVPYDAGKNWNLTIFTGSEFYAPFTSHSFIFFMIQNFIIHIGSPAGFGTDRTAARHANKAWPAAVVLFLDELVDLILREPDYSQLMELLWCRCSGSRFDGHGESVP